MTWTEVAIACIASFLLTVVFTRLLIPFLKSRQLGKTIREDGPAHQAKAGTPTMGGVGMLAAVGIVSIVMSAIWLWESGQSFSDIGAGIQWGFVGMILWPLAAMVAYAGLGALDDWHGLARKGRARELGVGLTARRLIVLQVLLVFALLALWWGFGVRDMLSEGLPMSAAIDGFVTGPQNLLLIPFTVLMIVAIVGTVNGVNFSDGLDGLCAGLLAIAFVGAGIAIVVARSGRPVTVEPAVSFIAAAACLGFLMFNRHPAQVFMGNVASMGLGALLAALAIVGNVWYLLPIIGAVFVAEVVSDIIQIVYFKRTGGKRFFLMAPIHHHFEKLGWPETKIVTVFWSCGLVAALAGVGLAALLARS